MVRKVSFTREVIYQGIPKGLIIWGLLLVFLYLLLRLLIITLNIGDTLFDT